VSDVAAQRTFRDAGRVEAEQPRLQTGRDQALVEAEGKVVVVRWHGARPIYSSALPNVTREILNIASDDGSVVVRLRRPVLDMSEGYGPSESAAGVGPRREALGGGAPSALERKNA